MEQVLSRIQKGIEWSFYSIFFLVPLVMHPSTSELFEFNKMWLVFGISLVILFLWISKMIITQEVKIRRTPLDIPIALFVLAHIVSTLFSLDSHVSFWGYYSRFNGGLLSILSYVFLYYAFVSNLIPTSKEADAESVDLRFIPLSAGIFAIGIYLSSLLPQTQGTLKTIAMISVYAVSLGLFIKAYNLAPVKKLLAIILTSAGLVALWGLPSHFGYDPTCFIFRQQLDTSCWTASFVPTVRIFSTLGQPNWLAAFLATLLPITIALGLQFFPLRKNKDVEKLLAASSISRKVIFGILALFIPLFYLDLLWTGSQSGLAGFWVGLSLFFTLALLLPILKAKSISLSAIKKTPLFLVIATTLLLFGITFVQGDNFQRLKPFTLAGIQERANQQVTTTTTQPEQTTEAPTPLYAPFAGSDSGEIRKFVWQGALDIFKQNPLFGTGVETFAFAYYQEKPIGHNLTSEWDFLYNKAHNEFLNYLATTGIFGTGSYLAFILLFYFVAFSSLLKQPKSSILSLALIGSFTTIHISNFFGFSVVIMNLFLFFIPALFFYYQNSLKNRYYSLTFVTEKMSSTISPGKWTAIAIVGIFTLYLQFVLYQYWQADIHYALGSNLNKIEQITTAYPELQKAYEMRPGEPVFQDEYSVNLASLALLAAQQNQLTQAQQFAAQAKTLSDDVIRRYPNNVLFYKTRTRVLYSLAQLNPQYLNDAVISIKKAEELAPTDAKIKYNLAVFTSQTGDLEGGIKILDETMKIKPNYRDAYYAKALLLTQLAESTETPADKAIEYKEQAKELLRFTLTNILPPKDDPISKELLDTLEQNKSVTTEE